MLTTRLSHRILVALVLATASAAATPAGAASTPATSRLCTTSAGPTHAALNLGVAAALLPSATTMRTSITSPANKSHFATASGRRTFVADGKKTFGQVVTLSSQLGALTAFAHSTDPVSRSAAHWAIGLLPTTHALTSGYESLIAYVASVHGVATAAQFTTFANDMMAVFNDLHAFGVTLSRVSGKNGSAIAAWRAACPGAFHL